MSDRRLTLSSVTWSRHQLVMRFALDDLCFSTVYWYPDVDLLDLDRRYGRDFMERVHVHSALFEINKIASLPLRKRHGGEARGLLCQPLAFWNHSLF